MLRAAAFLNSQYDLRKKKNPLYSQRAFSRALGINSGKLSQYFSGARLISKSMARKIATKIELDKEQTAYFLYLCEVDKQNKKTPVVRQLRDDQLALIVEWYHFAILSLIATKDFRLDPAWIGRRLGIPSTVAESSLKTLERIRMIRIEGKKVHLTPGPLATTEDVPNNFLVLSHQDTLRLVTENLPRVPVEKRDVSSITMALDDKKLPEAKKAIRAFRRRLAKMMVYGKKNQVYTLNIQLFPLSHEENS